MKRLSACLAAILSVVTFACASDVILVEKVGTSKMPIDLDGMKASGKAGEVFKKTLANDLALSGHFLVVEKGNLKISGEAHGGIEVGCVVQGAGGGKTFLSRKYSEASGEERWLAHRVADDIVFAVTENRGIASMKIVFVGKTHGRKDLYVCDADGNGLMRITNDGTPCVRPRWAPDGKTVYYMSYHKGFPDVYRINTVSKVRERVAAYPGLNLGSSVSPDGGTLALTLAKDGNPELYLLALNGGGLTRLTRTPNANEASPSWSPDGRSIVYVSNGFSFKKSGRPQLYIMTSSGGTPRRITSQGVENVSPDWGPDGRIVYASQRGGKYQVCIYDPATGAEKQITNDGVDSEDPSWAPDARHVVCSRSEGFKSNLYLIDTEADGGAPIRLTRTEGDWYSPDCSPQKD